MPYPVAHPAAVIPIGWLLGRHALWSALVIGSIAPDLWYLLPAVQRVDSHSIEGLLFFCLPASLAAYLAFHALKLPVLELLPDELARRLWACTTPGLPPVPWIEVAACLVAGAATHLVWDSLTHHDDYGRVIRHASTLLGGAAVLFFALRSLPPAPQPALPATLSPRSRVRALAGLCAIALAVAAWSAIEVLPLAPFDYEAARLLARRAGIDGAAALLWALCAWGIGRRICRRAIIAP